MSQWPAGRNADASRRGFSLLWALALTLVAFVVALGLSAAPALAATPCAAGSYSSTGDAPCTLAPAGYYVANSGGTPAALQACPAGTYSTTVGASSISTCINAPAGTFVDDPGQAEATPCLPGTYGPYSGLTQCVDAPPGSYVGASGALAATPCNAGTYQPSQGQMSCLDAPAGSLSVAGATEPTHCAVGTYQPDTGQSHCIEAPAGSVVSSSGAINATPCTLGYYQPQQGQISCENAPVGDYVGVTGATEATPCPAGTFQPNTGQYQCINAPAGSYVPAPVGLVGAAQASLCNAGTYQPLTGQASCLEAPIGTYTTSTGATATESCEPGTTTDYPGAAGPEGCLKVQLLQITSSPPAPATYGGSYPLTATGGGSGNPIVFSVDPFSTLGACTVSGSTVSFTGVGTCIIDAAQQGNATYANAATTQSFTIGQATLTVDAFPASTTYGTAPSLGGTVDYTGLVNGDTPSSAGVIGTPSCTLTTPETDAGTYAGDITCATGSLSSADYAFAPGNTATLTIGQATLTVDASPASTTYGTAATLTGAVNYTGLVNGDTPASAVVTGSPSCSLLTPETNAGTYTGDITCAAGSLSSQNYTFTTGNSATLTIAQATLTVDASPASTPYGTAPSLAGAVNYSGLVNGDTPSSAGVSGSPSCGLLTPESNAGTYTGDVTCAAGSLSSLNYAFATGNPATLTIAQATLTVDASPASTTYGTAPTLTGAVNYTGLVNGDTPASAGVTGSPTCSLIAPETNAGTYSGDVTCAAGSLSSQNYSFATGNPAALTIGQATLTVNASPASTTYGTAPTLTGSVNYTGLVNGDSPSSAGVSGSASCGLVAPETDAGIYSGDVTCATGSLSSQNYAFAPGSAATLTIGQATLTVNANPASTTYGTAPSLSGVVSYSGLVNGDTQASAGVTGSPSCSLTTPQTNAGSYSGDITCGRGSLSAANYTFATGNPATLTIGKATLTVNANPVSTTYGTAPSLSGAVNYGGLVNGDTQASAGVTGSPSCSLVTPETNVGTYSGDVTCATGSLSSQNYSLATGNPATLTIGKATLTVNANPASTTYGTAPTLTGAVNYSGLVNGDTQSSAGVSGSPSCSLVTPETNAGTYSGDITCAAGSLSSQNYAFAPGTTATLTIGKATVHVDANPASKVTGQPDPTPTGTLRASDFVNGDTASTAHITGAAACTIGSHAQTPGTYAGVITCAAGTLGAPNYTFVSGNAAALTIKDATTTSVSCSPSSVSVAAATTCTAKVTDTASSPTTPSGPVGFASNGAGSFSTSGSCTLSGSGASASCHVSYTPAAGGSLTITASYGGDAAHGGSSGTTGISVTKLTPSLSNPVRVSGQTADDTSSLSNLARGVTPTGTVTYKLYPRSGCTGTASSTQTVNLSGGTIPSSITTATLAAGPYSYLASYSGDGNYQSASSCQAFTIQAPSADLRVTISGPSAAGDGTSFTETVVVTNAGPASAGNVVTALAVPSGLTVTGTTGGGVTTSAAVTWTAATIANGASVTYTVTFKVAAHCTGSVKITVATASLVNPDPNLANNVASTTVVL